MTDLISREEAINTIFSICCRRVADDDLKNMLISAFQELPSAQTEVTDEDVKEYCRERCLCIVDSALLKKYAFLDCT